ncbi:hypothetical protein FRC10_003213 [Ceratobasidium sp. 414]|nr:hypothetical protein FRC10_003213 [Ceratobasidium sp. 414]
MQGVGAPPVAPHHDQPMPPVDSSPPSPLMASVLGLGPGQAASPTIDNPALLRDGVVGPLNNVFTPEAVEETITIYEDLPPEEVAMDQIKANAYTWAACHQRQGAHPHPIHWKSGLLTSASNVFTEALNNASRPLRVGELFNEVR